MQPNWKPKKIYYEPASLDYELGRTLFEKYKTLPWIPIESHNRIEAFRKSENSQFPELKQYLIIGIRKTHHYTPNYKSSDFLVPYTSSGCSAMCLYCYLVCNYNKCSYLRLFVNREQMLEKIERTAERAERELTFEIGSNSDLVLENTITHNLEWTIEQFAKSKRGRLTFPTKFDFVEPLLTLDHRRKTIARMSVNPPEIIRRVEFGTAPLDRRIAAVNRLCEAGYPVGLLIAPVILTGNWKELYAELFQTLAQSLSEKVKKEMFVEMILMTYSYVHRAINREAFPNAIDLYDAEQMTGRGRGKYCYRPGVRTQAEEFLRSEFAKYFDPAKILYIS